MQTHEQSEVHALFDRDEGLLVCRALLDASPFPVARGASLRLALMRCQWAVRKHLCCCSGFAMACRRYSTVVSDYVARELVCFDLVVPGTLIGLNELIKTRLRFFPALVAREYATCFALRLKDAATCPWYARAELHRALSHLSKLSYSCSTMYRTLVDADWLQLLARVLLDSSPEAHESLWHGASLCLVNARHLPRSVVEQLQEELKSVFSEKSARQETELLSNGARRRRSRFLMRVLSGFPHAPHGRLHMDVMRAVLYHRDLPDVCVIEALHCARVLQHAGGDPDAYLVELRALIVDYHASLSPCAGHLLRTEVEVLLSMSSTRFVR